MGKKLVFITLLILICQNSFSQKLVYQDDSYGEINREDFRETDFFSYDVEGHKTGTGTYTAKFKMNVAFDFQHTTRIFFQDEDGSIAFSTDMRWTLKEGQKVTIYFTVTHKDFGDSAYWYNERLLLVETSESTDLRPWKKFIANGNPYLEGWYLEDLGNGLYQERFYKQGRNVDKDTVVNEKQGKKNEVIPALKKTEENTTSDFAVRLKAELESLSDEEKEELAMYLMLYYLLVDD